MFELFIPPCPFVLHSSGVCLGHPLRFLISCMRSVALSVRFSVRVPDIFFFLLQLYPGVFLYLIDPGDLTSICSSIAEPIQSGGSGYVLY